MTQSAASVHGDPFATSLRLRDAYLRYLSESYPIHPSQPELRRLFKEKLRQPDAFCRDPLVSMIPSYETSLTPGQLFDRGDAPRLHRRLRKLSASELDPDRPLYRHQVEAIARIGSGRNTVVATGTGSGKTEAFLLPALDGCCRLDDEGGGKGVRAILIYPMNALANDQLGRMRKLVGDSGLSFGRYTGQTPEHEADADRDAHPTSERATRPAIRDQQPDLLLTNFAMLEYLLLRPRGPGDLRRRAVSRAQVRRARRGARLPRRPGHRHLDADAPPSAALPAPAAVHPH